MAHIDEDQMFHGAALVQIAEHPQFTAINRLKRKKTYHNAFNINDEIAIYLKHRESPAGLAKEYQFSFSAKEFETITEINDSSEHTYILLICGEAREICCLDFSELIELRSRRILAKKEPEEQYFVLVTAPKGKSLRAYVNAPNRKGTILGKSLIIARSSFPDRIFEGT